MIITDTHVRYWMARHRPAFGKHVRGQSGWIPTIHDCVNEHAAKPKEAPRYRWMALHNTMALLQLARRNGERTSIYLADIDHSSTDLGHRHWVRRFARGIFRASKRPDMTIDLVIGQCHTCFEINRHAQNCTAYRPLYARSRKEG